MVLNKPVILWFLILGWSSTPVLVWSWKPSVYPGRRSFGRLACSNKAQVYFHVSSSPDTTLGERDDGDAATWPSLTSVTRNSSGRHRHQQENLHAQLTQAARETWNWCAKFVVPHQLCPWAAASVETTGAIRIHVVDRAEEWEVCVEGAIQQFCDQVLDDPGKSIDPSRAIALVVLANDGDAGSSNLATEFEAFYAWFLYLEERWLDQAEINPHGPASKVTLAPFHPQWCFAGSESRNDPLDFEKRSPYPTVSIVSSAVIDRAGPAATQQIAAHNEYVLKQRTVAEWQQIYQQAVRLGDDTDRRDSNNGNNNMISP